MVAVDPQSIINQANQYQLMPAAILEQVITWLLAQYALLNPAPILTAAGGGNVSWTSAYIPSFWQIYVNGAIGTTKPGSYLSAGGLSAGSSVYIVGVASDGATPATQKSNTVIVT